MHIECDGDGCKSRIPAAKVTTDHGVVYQGKCGNCERWVTADTLVP